MKTNTIMLVEDDLAIQENLAAILEDEGYEVIRACNGADAMQQLAVGDLPQVIVMDLMMPVMNGWELRRQLLQCDDLARIPVVVLSGVHDVREKADALAPADYLEKPIELEELFGSIQRLSAG